MTPKPHKSSSIILASSSAARRAMLENCGVDFTAMPADLDEDELMLDWQKNHVPAEHVARDLSIAKAKKISALHPGALVIGSDQMLVCEGRWFSKASNIAAARGHIQFLSGKTHRLITGVAVVRAGECLWHHVDISYLHMHDLSPAEIDLYFSMVGDDVVGSVGCYQLENYGARLFADIRGDYFSILGLPLLPLLNFLRGQKIGV